MFTDALTGLTVPLILAGGSAAVTAVVSLLVQSRTGHRFHWFPLTVAAAGLSLVISLIMSAVTAEAASRATLADLRAAAAAEITDARADVGSWLNETYGVEPTAEQLVDLTAGVVTGLVIDSRTLSVKVSYRGGIFTLTDLAGNPIEPPSADVTGA